MRIVFIGAVKFSRRTLEHLIASGATIAGVCTMQTSDFNSDHADLAPICQLHGIPWIYVADINAPETLGWIAQRRPDIIFCFGWSRILKKDLLTAAPLGVVGYHPTALPKNRGRHPLIWALVLGLKRTGSTFFLMDEGADTGDILSQQEVVIDAKDDAGTLYKKITDTAISQLDDLVPALAKNAVSPVRQDSTQANVWRKRGPSDGRIDWRMTAEHIHNLVRGLTHPYVGAEFIYKGTSIKLWSSSVVETEGTNCEPGKVRGSENGHAIIQCGSNALRLLQTEPPLTAKVDEYLL